MSKSQRPTSKRPGARGRGDSNETDGNGDLGSAPPANDNRKHRRQTLRDRNRKIRRPPQSYRERRALAWREHERRVDALWRKRSSLADEMQGCTRRERCGSGACPLCVIRLQHQLARALRRCTATVEEGAQIVTVTLVAPDDEVPVKLLCGRDHRHEMRRWKRRLMDCNLEWAVGGVDFSCNENRDGEHEPYWMPHLYLIGVTRDIRELRRQLKRTFPARPGCHRPVKVIGEIRELQRQLKRVFAAQPGCPRPVKVQPWDGRQNALLYCFKGDFTRRVSYRGERFDPRRGRMAACRKTSGQRLRAAQKIELLEHLHKIGLTRRIFSLRAQVHRDPKGISIRKV